MLDIDDVHTQFFLDSIFEKLKEEITHEEPEHVEKSAKKAGMQNALLNFVFGNAQFEMARMKFSVAYQGQDEK